MVEELRKRPDDELSFYAGVEDVRQSTVARFPLDTESKRCGTVHADQIYIWTGEQRRPIPCRYHQGEADTERSRNPARRHRRAL